MDPARWEQVQTLFHRAASLDAAERSRFLAEACGDDAELLADVRGMLEEDGRGWLLDRDVREVAGRVAGDAFSALSRNFGPYRIEKILGEGGMGVVYLARREDLGNHVAIKLLRDAWLSPERRQRFALEQRTLARLNHPSIARLYDANTLPDGTPWFVMEYVDGVAVTDYCSRNHSTVDERLRLIRAVAEAVEYAHGEGVIHRDIKPSNIFVRDDGAVRLLDFGIAKQLDPAGQPLNHTRTAMRSMTLAYASPEQIRGDTATTATDIYSLGVVLYELLTGRLPFDLTGKTALEAEAVVTTQEPARPSSIARRPGDGASWGNLDALCLTAMHKDPARRYASAAALMRDIDRYLNREPLEAKAASRPAISAFVRRNSRALSIASTAVVVLALVAAAVVLTLDLSRKPVVSPQPARAIAVLPLINGSEDHGLDFLAQAIADEITGTLGYARSISLRSVDRERKYNEPVRDLQKEGRALQVSTIVSGQFLRAGNQLQITLEVTDVATNRLLWSDVFEVPPQDLMAMQAQVASKTRRALAPVLGVTEFVTANPPRPGNEEAYRLYLRARDIPVATAADPKVRKRLIEMLSKSVELDPSYAPAWEILARFYSDDGFYGDGGQVALARWRAAIRKAAELDPGNTRFQAETLYFATSDGRGPESGGMTRGQAFRGLQDLLRRRPDSARLHFIVSWMLRDAGLLDESAHECEMSFLIDAHDAGARSCGVTFMLRGDFRRAVDFLNLDPDAAISKGVRIDVLARQGKNKEALEALDRNVPQWSAFDVLTAVLQHRPEQNVAALARQAQPSPDPENNYLAAAHLADAGQTDAALTMLKSAIAGGYCSYPSMDSDPLLANLRSSPGFGGVRAAGIACQKKFLAERATDAGK